LRNAARIRRAEVIWKRVSALHWGGQGLPERQSPSFRFVFGGFREMRGMNSAFVTIVEVYEVKIRRDRRDGEGSRAPVESKPRGNRF
jgi:hypothetical protein